MKCWKGKENRRWRDGEEKVKGSRRDWGEEACESGERREREEKINTRAIQKQSKSKSKSQPPPRGHVGEREGGEGEGAGVGGERRRGGGRGDGGRGGEGAWGGGRRRAGAGARLGGVGKGAVKAEHSRVECKKSRERTEQSRTESWRAESRAGDLMSEWIDVDVNHQANIKSWFEDIKLSLFLWLDV